MWTRGTISKKIDFFKKYELKNTVASKKKTTPQPIKHSKKNISLKKKELSFKDCFFLASRRGTKLEERADSAKSLRNKFAKRKATIKLAKKPPVPKNMARKMSRNIPEILLRIVPEKKAFAYVNTPKEVNEAFLKFLCIKTHLLSNLTLCSILIAFTDFTN